LAGVNSWPFSLFCSENPIRGIGRKNPVNVGFSSWEECELGDSGRARIVAQTGSSRGRKMTLHTRVQRISLLSRRRWRPRSVGAVEWVQHSACLVLQQGADA